MDTIVGEVDSAFEAGTPQTLNGSSYTAIADGTRSFAFTTPASAGWLQVDVGLNSCLPAATTTLYLQLYDGSLQVGSSQSTHLSNVTVNNSAHAHWLVRKTLTGAVTYTVRALCNTASIAITPGADWNVASWLFQPRW